MSAFDWVTGTLDEVAEVVRGVTYKKSVARSAPEPGLIPLLRATNIGRGLDLDGDLVYVPASGVTDQQRLRVGDIVMASSSGSLSVVGKSARLSTDWEGTFGAFCAVVRPTTRIDDRFLALYLSSEPVRRRWSEAARGTNINNLKKSDLAPTLIPLPSLGEQRRIVDILEDHLSRIDAADRGLAASLKRLESMRLSMLTHEVQGPAKTLGVLAVAAEYGTSTKCVVDGAGMAVARIPNVADGVIDMSDEKRAVDASVDLSSLTLRTGDVLIVRTNGSKNLIGRSAVIQAEMDVAFASYLIRYRFDERRVLPSWVHFALETPSVRTHLERQAASSAGQHNLGLKKLDAVRIPCPELDIQRASMARIIEQSEGIAALQRCLRASQRRSAWLRRGLLAAAFSGQLTGRFSDDEVIEKAAGAQAGAHAVHVLANDLAVPASAEPRGA